MVAFHDQFWPESPAWQVRLLWLGVIAAILLGAWVIFRVDRWRKKKPPEQLSSADQLSHFRQLYERGELSPEEFGRIRALLGERLRHELDIPPKPAEEQPPPAQPPPA